ncbi:MAG: class I SAM-dependent methyltransferase [Thermoplasmata archaeon]
MDLVQDILLGLIVVVAALIYFIFASFIFGAGYQPTNRRVVDRMMTEARVVPSDKLYDLGAGTGAIVFVAARKYGAFVVGVEVDPIRMLILRVRRALGRARDRIELRWGNLFDLEFRDATVVTVFLWPGAMEKLRDRFERQLPAGARVVSHWHRVPGWKWVSFDAATHVYLYHWDGSAAVEH